MYASVVAFPSTLMLCQIKSEDSVLDGSTSVFSSTNCHGCGKSRGRILVITGIPNVFDEWDVIT